MINNADLYPDEGLTILTLSRDRLAQTFHTNTCGPLEVIQAFLPFLQKSRRMGHERLQWLRPAEGLSANVPSYCLSSWR